MKQVLIIGLGQFGKGLVNALRKKGVEIVAVDIDEDRVNAVSRDVEQALCLDATREEALASLSPSTRDVCICATGDESPEVAIISTALLKQMGAKRIISRANDALHARILKLVGADETVNPELEFGKTLIDHIVHQDVVQQMELGSNVVVTEVQAPKKLIGKTLLELNLRQTHGVSVVAIKKESGEVELPTPEHKIDASDALVLVSKKDSLKHFVSE